MNSHLFNSIYFVKSWRNCLGLIPEGPYLSLEKENEIFCAVFTNSIKRVREIRKFQVAHLHGRLRNAHVHKSVMHVQRCCFANLYRLLFCCSLLLKLPFVVIQKCCYCGNVTSHFSIIRRVK